LDSFEKTLKIMQIHRKNNLKKGQNWVMTIAIFLQDLLYKVLQGTLESKLEKKK